jgi:signal peptidase I
MSNKQKIINEVKAIGIIVTVALLIKVTVLEAYIVPTGSMENTIMTGDFLIGSRFVYGMRTPDWIGIPYTDKGFFIPYIKFPAFKTPKKGDVLIFKYPRDKYVKYVKRCVAGPGDTLFVDAKKVFINGEEVLLSENGKFVQPILPEGYRQTEIFLHSENNRNKDYFGPIVIPKKGDVIQINENTDWRFLLPLMIMEGHSATLKISEKVYSFTLQDPNELYRRKDDKVVFNQYFPNGNLLTPWSRSIKDAHFQYLIIDGKPISEWNDYTLTQNYYWAMGDNRDDSLDSRYWGFIGENYILGEAVFIYFSLDIFNTWFPRFERMGTIIQ